MRLVDTLAKGFGGLGFLLAAWTLTGCEPGGLSSDEVQIIDGSVLLSQETRTEVREDDFSTFPGPVIPGAVPLSDVNPILIIEDGGSRQVQTFYRVDRSPSQVIEFYQNAIDTISSADDFLLLGALPNGDQATVVVRAVDDLQTESEVEITVFQPSQGGPTHELREGDFGNEIDRLTNP